MGGNAFEGMRRINKGEVAGTLRAISVAVHPVPLKVSYLEKHLLGSAGKNPTSGDLDINMDERKFSLPELEEALVRSIGADNVKARPGNNQIFTKFPIMGDPEQGFVQVDFMFGDVDWQRFSYWSPRVTGQSQSFYYDSDASAYKGLFRTELIKALVAFNSDWVLEENGEMVARVGPTFFHDRGIVWRYRYRPFKRGSTTERIKALKEVTKEEFMEVFPSAFEASGTVENDPVEVIKLLFDSHYNEEGLYTYESVMQAIRYSYNVEQRAEIGKIYLERLNSLKVDVPKEIIRAHNIGAKRI